MCRWWESGSLVWSIQSALVVCMCFSGHIQIHSMPLCCWGFSRGQLELLWPPTSGLYRKCLLRVKTMTPNHPCVGKPRSCFLTSYTSPRGSPGYLEVFLSGRWGCKELRRDEMAPYSWRVKLQYFQALLENPFNSSAFRNLYNGTNL